jgi:hypothetical protein
MLELTFDVEKAEPKPFAVGPLLAFKVRIGQKNAAEEATLINTVVLRCQIRIQVARRRYAPAEQERLRDLFATPDRWSQTLQPLLWTQTSVVVPPFVGRTTVDLPVPCTFDFNVAVTKYFYALEDGEVPLLLLFSGTVFYEAEDGGLQVTQLPWDRETTFRLPVQVWKDMMEHYYPNSAWLCLRKDAFDRLYDYKSRHGLPTWEQALESLLADDR